MRDEGWRWWGRASDDGVCGGVGEEAAEAAEGQGLGTKELNRYNLLRNRAAMVWGV